MCAAHRDEVNNTDAFGDPDEQLQSFDVGDATTRDGKTLVPTTITVTEDGESAQLTVQTVVVKEDGKFLVCDFRVEGGPDGG